MLHVTRGMSSSKPKIAVYGQLLGNNDDKIQILRIEGDEKGKEAYR